jgi:hypothetical protein
MESESTVAIWIFMVLYKTLLDTNNWHKFLKFPSLNNFLNKFYFDGASVSSSSTIINVKKNLDRWI